MKKLFMLLIVVSLCSYFLGCASGRSFPGRGGSGGGGGGGTGTIQAGNWTFTTNGGINGPIFMGGQLNVSNNTVSGNLTIVGTQASGFLIGPNVTAMTVTGTVSNGTLTLSGVAVSSSVTLTLTNLPSSGTVTSLSGTYSVTGGADNNDAGTVTGALAGDFSGIWSGTDSSTGGTLTVEMSESTTPDTLTGRFPLTSTGSGVTFTGAVGCTVTGTLNADSFAAGGILLLDITTTDNGVPGNLIVAGVADDPTAPTTLSSGSFYAYNGGSGCMLRNTGNAVGFTMAKQ
jgi:hypothetical protein